MALRPYTRGAVPSTASSLPQFLGRELLKLQTFLTGLLATFPSGVTFDAKAGTLSLTFPSGTYTVAATKE